MNTRTCRNCGWVHPATYQKRKCKFCNAAMPYDTHCAYCGKFVAKVNKSDWLCKDCSTMYARQREKNIRIRNNKKYEEWLDEIKLIPTPYKTLTEDEWLAACKHFGGCAYCGSDDISARSMFIDFKDGGRYCSWNIIPSCERCETAWKSTNNPFIRMNSTIGRCHNSAAKKYGWNTTKLQTIVDYLHAKIEEVLNEHEQQT